MKPMEIYVLNVRQADTSIIRTPCDNIIIIDAVMPRKVRNVLDGIKPEGVISHLIVTHAHLDHYNAVQSLLEHYHVCKVTLSPFWHDSEEKPGYHAIVNSLLSKNTPVDFLSGYKRTYPDGGEYKDLPDGPCLELLGPPNDILKKLRESDAFNANHLSIIARLTYGEFGMVFAADAQMENWVHYDREGMLEEECCVLKAAHHGSKRGTQWERLERLSPKYVIVSSDPQGYHQLPDLVGSATFLEYDKKQDHIVALTSETGTIKISIQAPPRCDYEVNCYREGSEDPIFPGTESVLPQTDWASIVRGKIDTGAQKTPVQTEESASPEKTAVQTDGETHLAALAAKKAVKAEHIEWLKRCPFCNEGRICRVMKPARLGRHRTPELLACVCDSCSAMLKPLAPGEWLFRCILGDESSSEAQIYHDAKLTREDLIEISEGGQPDWEW